MKEISYQKIVYWVLFLILLIVSLIVIKPFILIVLTGMIIAYIFYPVYLKILKKFKRKWISALITSILIILIFSIPITIIAHLFINESYVTYIVLKQKIYTVFSSEIVCEESGIKCAVVNYFTGLFQDSRFNVYLNNALGKAATYMIEQATNFVVSVPKKILELFILLFVMFYTFKDGDKLVKNFWLILPLKKEHQQKIGKKVTDIINSTIYGTILVSVVQGIIAAVGYWIFGVGSPLILGIVTAFAALLPVVGTALIWVPAFLFLIINGISTGNNTAIFNGIGLLIYGVVLISSVDNLVKPAIIGSRARLHPALVLLGVFGGLAMFGIAGIILGPLVLALFTTFIEIYRETEFK